MATKTTGTCQGAFAGKGTAAGRKTAKAAPPAPPSTGPTRKHGRRRHR